MSPADRFSVGRKIPTGLPVLGEDGLMVSE